MWLSGDYRLFRNDSGMGRAMSVSALRVVIPALDAVWHSAAH